jgi:hypothetical protein
VAAKLSSTPSPSPGMLSRDLNVRMVAPGLLRNQAGGSAHTVTYSRKTTPANARPATKAMQVSRNSWWMSPDPDALPKEWTGECHNGNRGTLVPLVVSPVQKKGPRTGDVARRNGVRPFR